MKTLELALRRAAMIGLGVAASAGVAAAQGTPDQPSPDPRTDPVIITTPEPTTMPPAPVVVYTTEPVATYVEPETPFLERYGVAFVLGGGVDGFTNDAMRSSTKDGGSWDARAIFGTRDWVGFEAAYIGSAQQINALGLDGDAMLVGNGVQGNLRLNLTRDSLVQPFAFAGAAWRHYDLQNVSINTSDVRDSDDVLEIPVGVGLAYKYDGFMIDARGEFRAATGEDLMAGDSGNTQMHRWGVNANLGYAF